MLLYRLKLERNSNQQSKQTGAIGVRRLPFQLRKRKRCALRVCTSEEYQRRVYSNSNWFAVLEHRNYRAFAYLLEKHKETLRTLRILDMRKGQAFAPVPLSLYVVQMGTPQMIRMLYRACGNSLTEGSSAWHCLLARALHERTGWNLRTLVDLLGVEKLCEIPHKEGVLAQFIENPVPSCLATLLELMEDDMDSWKILLQVPETVQAPILSAVQAGQWYICRVLLRPAFVAHYDINRVPISSGRDQSHTVLQLLINSELHNLGSLQSADGNDAMKRLRIAHKLIRRGVDVNAYQQIPRPRTKETVLGVLVRFQRAAELINFEAYLQLLFSADQLHVNAVQSLYTGFLPLHAAVVAGCLIYKRSPSYQALLPYYSAIVSLSQRGANLLAPLVLEENPNDVKGSFINSTEICEVQRTHEGATALHLAATCPSPYLAMAIVSEMRRRDPSKLEDLFSARDRLGRTPIQAAALHNCPATAGWLCTVSAVNRDLLSKCQWNHGEQSSPTPWLVLRKGYRPEYVFAWSDDCWYTMPEKSELQTQEHLRRRLDYYNANNLIRPESSISFWESLIQSMKPSICVVSAPGKNAHLFSVGSWMAHCVDLVMTVDSLCADLIPTEHLTSALEQLLEKRHRVYRDHDVSQLISKSQLDTSVYRVEALGTLSLADCSTEEMPLSNLHIFYNNFCDTGAEEVHVQRVIVKKRPIPVLIPLHMTPPASQISWGFPAVLGGKGSASWLSYPPLIPTLGVCHFDRTPMDLVQKILSYFELKHLIHARSVSKQWRDAVAGVRFSVDIRYLSNWLTDDRVETMAKSLCRMRELQLQLCKNITDCSMKAIGTLAALEHLDIHMFASNLLSTKALPLLEPLTRLLSLKIEANQGAAMNDTALNSLNRFSLLRSLTIHKATLITDAGITTLTALHQLRHLDLGWCERLQDISLRHIARHMSDLESLSVARCTLVTADGVKHLATRIPTLRKLDLAWCTCISAADISQHVMPILPPGCRVLRGELQFNLGSFSMKT